MVQASFVLAYVKVWEKEPEATITLDIAGNSRVSSLLGPGKGLPLGLLLSSSLLQRGRATTLSPSATPGRDGLGGGLLRITPILREEATKSAHVFDPRRPATMLAWKKKHM